MNMRVERIIDTEKNYDGQRTSYANILECTVLDLQEQMNCAFFI